jgi:formylglycine-generating enzyme required for sulfatase activity
MYGNNKLKSPECMDWIKSKKYEKNQPVEVKSYPPNPWGLYDMHGNVWEWCQDLYHDYLDHTGRRMSVEDIKTPSRVRRGGSWYGKGNSCRSANRNYGHPGSKFQTTGFRLVLEVP